MPGGMSSPSFLHILLMLILFFIHGLEADPKSRCRKSERDALAKFKQGLVDPYNLLNSWVGEDCCLWYGVSCSNTSGHVVELYLTAISDEQGGPYRGIGGKIGHSLSNLTYLETLYLGNNNFSGSIPDSLGQLRRLEFLSLAHNFLGGPIPDSIGRLSRLRSLYLDDNLLNGSITASIGQLSNLEDLSLSANLLKGSIPQSFGNLSKLETLEIQGNLLNGIVSENHFAHLKSLRSLDMSDNSLVFDIDPNWVAPFQPWLVDLSSCKVGPNFPQWLKSQSNNSLEMLWLNKASISDSIPDWFQNISSNIRILDLSHNQITNHLPKLFAKPLERFQRTVYLYSNKLQGPLIDFTSDVSELDISDNLLYGQIPPTIGNMMPELISLSLSNNQLNGSIPTSLFEIEHLQFLDLSMNHLSGTIPRCWKKHDSLLVLDLANNNLSDHIPESLGFFENLKSLHLEKNNLNGEVPSSLGNLSGLWTLDLSENAFVGSISRWVSDNFELLQILNVHSNNFNGEIPPKLCHLTFLRILDLANNNMTGTIPPCLQMFLKDSTFFRSLQRGIGEDPYNEHVKSYMKGRAVEYSHTILQLLYSIDLSENNFFGTIPIKLMNLSMLQSLNLSGNNLAGNIPPNIGKMRSLESLDLSRNELSGLIPSSISELNFLSHLNLSFNNLSGAIPHGNQLQTLDDKSIYIGNSGLCGPPLGICQGEDPEVATESDEDGLEFEMIWFYCGLSVGFFSGFVGFCGALYFCDSWRYACFGLVEKIYNELWIIVAIKTNQIRRKLGYI